MERRGKIRRSGVWAFACWLGTSTAPLAAADSFVWKTQENRVDAEIDAWPLPRLLERITAATGWQVYVEPGTDHSVTAHFRQLKPSDALLRLLGDLNFALLPQATGPAQLFIYRHSVSDATQLVRLNRELGPQARTGEPLPGEVIVRLKPGVKGGIGRLSKRVDGKVVGRLDSVDAYRLRFKDEAAARRARTQLEGDGDVASLESNFPITPPAAFDPLPMSSQPRFSLTPDVTPSRDGVVVGLIDTAVQTGNPAFAGFLQSGVSLYPDHQPPRDGITHGTAMAETILDGVAQLVLEQSGGNARVPLSILPVDVYGGNDMTNTFDVARGLYEALNRHVNVINLSLGGELDSPLVRSLIQDAVSRGVLVFAAAGNMPGTTPIYPAADPGVIAVTAGDGRGAIAPYANRGSFVDAMAPGTNVVHYGDRAWLGAGTSFATGWVTGWTAGFMARSNRSSSATQSATLQRWGMGSR
jgi:hypothetical protein